MNEQRGRHPTPDIIVMALILGCPNVVQYITPPELRDQLQTLADAYNYLRPYMRSRRATNAPLNGDAIAGQLITNAMLQILRAAKEVQP